jgi:uncharacterized repeat protein (TIGR02059 family)
MFRRFILVRCQRINIGRIITIFFAIIICRINLPAYGQNDLIISGKTYNNSEDSWQGVNIPRETKVNLVFSNNTITSANRYGYMLQAGDESPASSNNNLDNAIITGNRFNWTGKDMTVIPHGIFTGHNKNVSIKYNYLSYVPMGIVRKSGNNMANTSGGIAYNIVKGGAVAVVVKGMSNVNIFNNTFYNDRTKVQTWRPLVYIYTNTDRGVYSVSHGTRIYNNIFYTRYQTPMISVLDQESLNGLESDYNVFWCENGAPVFEFNGTQISFDEWKAMGYDLHSTVINPRFNDLNSFVPAERLNLGTSLGDEWKEGLSVNARWGAGDPETTSQDSNWQVGAVLYGETGGGDTYLPVVTQSVIQMDAPAILEITFSDELAQITPPPSAFVVAVNSVQVQIEKVSISGNKIFLTLGMPVNEGDEVTMSYTPPAQNAIQSISGKIAGASKPQPVIINILSGDAKIKIYPNPARTFFNIANVDSDQLPQIVRIYDITGKLCFEMRLEYKFMYKVPINLRPGIYVLHLEIGSSIKHIQKLVVVE